MRWEYSTFSYIREGDTYRSVWTGPDGTKHDMPGPEEVILTTLGHNGWEAISAEFHGKGITISQSRVSSYYLLKRPLGELTPTQP